MNSNGVALDQLRLESLHRQPMERRGAIQENRMFPSYFVQGVPDNRLFALNHLLRRADRVHLSQLFQAPNNERFKQNQSHFLRQTALVQLQFWTDHDDRTSGIIHPLAQQVHPESSRLTLQHIRKRLERTIARTRHCPAMPTIVHQGVDRLL